MSLIADVFDVVLVDNVGDVIGTTTLQDANIQFQVQENEVRAGKGNQLIGILHAQRDITIDLTDMEFRYEWLAKQLGQTIVTGAGVAYAMPKFYTVSDNAGTKTITLDETPDSIDSLAIYDVNGAKLVKTTDFTLTTDTVTITKTGVAAGDSVEVRTYTYATDATTETIEFDGAVFAKGVKAILETVEINGDETITHKLQYQFDNAVPSGNFTLNTQSQRNAVTNAFNLRVLKPENSSIVGRALRMPIGA